MHEKFCHILWDVTCPLCSIVIFWKFYGEIQFCQQPVTNSMSWIKERAANRMDSSVIMVWRVRASLHTRRRPSVCYPGFSPPVPSNMFEPRPEAHRVKVCVRWCARIQDPELSTIFREKVTAEMNHDGTQSQVCMVFAAGTAFLWEYVDRNRRLVLPFHNNTIPHSTDSQTCLAQGSWKYNGDRGVTCLTVHEFVRTNDMNVTSIDTLYYRFRYLAVRKAFAFALLESK